MPSSPGFIFVKIVHLREYVRSRLSRSGATTAFCWGGGVREEVTAQEVTEDITEEKGRRGVSMDEIVTTGNLEIVVTNCGK